MSDDSRLLELASAVVEGSDVNWDEVEEQSADERERSVARELRLLAGMSNVTRESPPTPAAVVAGQKLPDSPRVWGHLRLLEQIGRGSFGDVYRAWDLKLEREVALKFVRSAGGAESVNLSRALREARALARIRHQNVVAVYGADLHEETVGVWMELIKGRTLNEVVKSQGPMSANEAMLIGIDLCHAVAAVHGAGLVHRDLKANNVMREEGGRVVLMDFGAGRPIPVEGELTHDLVGTPAYLAPELFLGRKPSVASDIYSLGVLLYYLVTGGYPVEGSNAREVDLAHEREQRKHLRDVRPDLPSAFIEVVEHALSPNQKNRYRSAGSFASALAGIGGGSPKTVRSKIGPRLKWLTVAAVAVVLIGGLWMGRPKSGQDPRDVVASPTPVQRSAQLSGSPEPDAYRVTAEFYSLRDGRNISLTAGSGIAPGDKLFLTLDVSKPVFVYVVNQDDKGESYLLFPLPGQELTNPVSAGINRFPGAPAGEELYWQVTSAGGREHFYLFATPERLTAFEQMLTALPHAEFGKAIVSAPLPKNAVGILRGVGGLVKEGQASSPSSPSQLGDLAPLQNGSEAARGLWARQITFDNPAK